MVIYTVYADTNALWASQMNSDDQFLILEPKLKMEINRAGSFEFKMPPNHPRYNSLTNVRTVIRIFENGTEIWRGRVLDQTDDIYKIRTVTCEGVLAYLNDFQAGPHGSSTRSPSQMMDDIFAIYNKYATQYRNLRKGNVIGFGDKKFYTAKNDAYHNLSDAFFSEMVGACGGFVRLRYAGGEVADLTQPTYVDYYQTLSTSSTQNIQFGVNLLDYAHKKSGSDVYTAITPVGGTVKNIFPINSRKGGRWVANGKYENTANWSSGNGTIDREGHTDVTVHFDSESTDSSEVLTIYAWSSKDLKEGQLLHSWGINRTTQTLHITGIPSNSVCLTISMHNSVIGHVGIALGYAVTNWNGDAKLQIRLNGNNDSVPWTDKTPNESYYYSNDAVNKYGLITQVVNFDIDDNLTALMTQAKATLANAQKEIESFDISAVDLRLLGYSVDKIEVGDLVQIVSIPHGIDTPYQCTAIEYDLDEPGNTTYSLGIVGASITGTAISNQSRSASASASASATAGALSVDALTSAVMANIRETYVTKDDLADYPTSSTIAGIQSRLSKLETETEGGVVTKAQYDALVARVKALEDNSK